MCSIKILVFDIVCDEKEDADRLMEEFALLGFNVCAARQTAIFARGTGFRKDAVKQKEIYRVSVDLDVFEGEDIKVSEKKFVAAYEKVLVKSGMKLSGEYEMHLASYGVAFPR